MTAMPHDQSAAPAPTELRKLPPEERAEILRRQAKLEEPLIRTYPELIEWAELGLKVLDNYSPDE